MRLNVKCFATLMPHTPPGEACEWTPEQPTVSALMAHLKVPADEVKLIFINGRAAEPDDMVKEGDRVGLFPPVGGG